MQKYIFLLTILAFFLSSFGFAFAQQTPTVSPSPETATPAKKKNKKHQTEEVAATPSPSPSETPEPKPRWVPPPVLDDSAKLIRYQINALYVNDINGSNLYSTVDLLLRRRLDKYNVSAEGDIRFTKDVSTSYDAGQIQVRTADVSYSEVWLTGALGRLNVGDTLSPMHFFGNYATMGIRRLDGIQLTLPIAFSFGVVDYDKVQAPPTGLTLFYFPSVFSSQYLNLDTSQSLFLGQLRFSSKAFDVPFVLRFNLGGSSTDFFKYSSFNGGLTGSAAAEFTIEKNYTFYTEAAIQDFSNLTDSSVIAFGLNAQHLITFGPISVDNLIAEMQVPLGYSLDNTFTGGNPFIPSTSVYGQKTFMLELKTRLKAININLYATNTPGDYTLARLNASNSSYPKNVPFGLGNELEGIGVPLLTNSYSNISYMATVGVEW